MCEYCHQSFTRHSSNVAYKLKIGKHFPRFCSKKCKDLACSFFSILPCAQCQKLVKKLASQLRKAKQNIFCSRSCAAIYNNTHKTKGNRRSKLEFWLELQLSIFYPTLEIVYCDKRAINSELDIYIPSLKLAFELNGIFHYEPIYGDKKLNQIQNNDHRKFQACLEQGVELCIIDVSSLKYFKESAVFKYLHIIQQIIDKRITSN